MDIRLINNTPRKMKKIISELRKTIAVILLEHAMDVCPKGEFKLELAKFVERNVMKL